MNGNERSQRMYNVNERDVGRSNWIDCRCSDAKCEILDVQLFSYVYSEVGIFSTVDIYANSYFYEGN